MTSSLGQYRHGHGHHHRPHHRTEFAAFPHEHLVTMLFDGLPPLVAETAEGWAAVGRSLHEHAGNLERMLTGFEDMWAGGAADNFEAMIRDLAGGIHQVADYALGMYDATASAGEALQVAQASMPPPMSVPVLPPQIRSIVAAPPNLDGMTVAQANDALHQYSQARTLAQQHELQQQQAAAQQGDAVVVMTTLATRYNDIEDSIPDAPPAGSMPTGVGVSGDDVTPIGGDGTAPGLVPGVDPANPNGTTPTLFGNVFRAGLLAASAALGGRFAPPVTELIKRNTPTTAANLVPGTGVPAVDSAVAKLGGGAGGGGGGAHFGGGGGGGLGGSGATPPAPTGSGTLTGTASSTLSGLAAAGAVAKTAGTTGGMMGGMPMGMMGGMGDSGMGGARRVPAWLQETEDIWGESTAITPPVIGDD